MILSEEDLGVYYEYLHTPENQDNLNEVFDTIQALRDALSIAKDFIAIEAINPIDVAGSHAEHLERLIAQPGCDSAKSVLKRIERIETGSEPAPVAKDEK